LGSHELDENERKLEWRIKVGTPLQIYWKQRSKKVWEVDRKRVYTQPAGGIFKQVDGSEKLFNAECVETFLVKIGKDEEGFYYSMNAEMDIL